MDGVERVRKCGRSMNRDRGTGMRLTERTRKLIPDSRDMVEAYLKERSVMRNEDYVGMVERG